MRESVAVCRPKQGTPNAAEDVYEGSGRGQCVCWSLCEIFWTARTVKTLGHGKRCVEVCDGGHPRWVISFEAVRSFMSVDYFEEQRRQTVAAIRAITDHVGVQISKSELDNRVLQAMAKVPRHEFVPVEVQQYAYLNRRLPIGFDKTISQPLIVAVMTDL